MPKASPDSLSFGSASRTLGVVRPSNARSRSDNQEAGGSLRSPISKSILRVPATGPRSRGLARTRYSSTCFRALAVSVSLSGQNWSFFALTFWVANSVFPSSILLRTSAIGTTFVQRSPSAKCQSRRGQPSRRCSGSRFIEERRIGRLSRWGFVHFFVHFLGPTTPRESEFTPEWPDRTVLVTTHYPWSAFSWHLAKVGVAGSNPVVRSKESPGHGGARVWVPKTPSNVSTWTSSWPRTESATEDCSWLCPSVGGEGHQNVDSVPGYRRAWKVPS